jgi:hypothetical protein
MRRNPGNCSLDKVTKCSWALFSGAQQDSQRKDIDNLSLYSGRLQLFYVFFECVNCHWEGK